MKQEKATANEDALHSLATTNAVAILAKILAQFDNDAASAAQALGISLPALQEKMKDYGLC